MYNIIMKNEKYKYELAELVRLFLKPSEFKLTIPERSTIPDLVTVDGDIIIELSATLEKRDALKRYLFDMLSNHTGYRPPWGILTGVRPVKMVNGLYASGLVENEIRMILKDEYAVRADKIDLLMETSKNQRALNLPNKNDLVSIYIGIPFCPTRCIYCSFTSNKADDRKIDLYLATLYREIAFVAEALRKTGQYPETIYIGGGTPTSISEKKLEDLLAFINMSFNMSECREFTVEAGRPDTISAGKLAAISGQGGTRISINPQSMNMKTLKIIGRDHTPEQIVDAYKIANASSTLEINADIIAGLPGESAADFEKTLEMMLKLRPSNMTVHTLALKRSSKLKEMEEDYNYRHGTDLDEMIDLSSKKLVAAGYKPYYLYRQKQMSGNFENVGYALPGKECIYNIRIMEEKQTNIALGAGGISKFYFPAEDRLERVPNVSNYEIYIDRIDEMIERKRVMFYDENQNNISAMEE
jgi:coproporphyrinogen dehydrogenase HemZ